MLMQIRGEPKSSEEENMGLTSGTLLFVAIVVRTCSLSQVNSGMKIGAAYSKRFVRGYWLRELNAFGCQNLRRLIICDIRTHVGPRLALKNARDGIRGDSNLGSNPLSRKPLKVKAKDV